MISSTLKPHTNAHTVSGRPTLNVFERFLKGSLRGLYERSIYERTFLSEPIENHARCISNELSNVNHAKNKLHKHYRVFRRDREPSRIPIRTLERLRNKNRKVKEFLYKGIRSYTPKSSNKRQLRLHHVDFLAFTVRYARKDTQVSADMHLVLV